MERNEHAERKRAPSGCCEDNRYIPHNAVRHNSACKASAMRTETAEVGFPGINGAHGIAATQSPPPKGSPPTHGTMAIDQGRMTSDDLGRPDVGMGANLR